MCFGNSRTAVQEQHTRAPIAPDYEFLRILDGYRSRKRYGNAMVVSKRIGKKSS